MKNKNLARIHILKNKLTRKGVPSVSEETYRALLQESYQVTSSKGLSLTQQKELIYYLNSQVQDSHPSYPYGYVQKYRPPYLILNLFLLKTILYLTNKRITSYSFLSTKLVIYLS